MLARRCTSLLLLLFGASSSLALRIDASRFGRRHVLSAAAPLAAAAAAVATLPTPAANAASLTREGMAAFAANKVEESIEKYDKIIAEQPAAKPYLWQRGLSLYYADRYADGAEQFAADVAVNPNDTEEQIWHLLCLAQIKGGLAAARPFKLTVGTDRRPVMRAVQKLFLSGTDDAEAELAALARGGDTGSRFYAALYLSLYHESLGDKAKAESRMREAVKTDYALGQGARDPMVELANVAMQRRGWSS